MATTSQGWLVVTMPGTPAAPKDVQISLNDAVAVSISPFTGQQQVQFWGTLPREASVSLPPLPHSVAEEWVSFFSALQGQANVFQFSATFQAAYPEIGARYWRLADNKRTFSINDNRFYGFQFNIREAL